MSNPHIVAEIASFAFVNRSGGTGLSSWKHDERYPAQLAKARLVKCFTDYETGLRFIGHSADPVVDAYLDKVAAADRRIFFSEFELKDPTEAQQLFKRFAVAVGKATTSDGFTFLCHENGQWNDGDMTFNSWEEMMESCEITIELPETTSAGSSVTNPPAKTHLVKVSVDLVFELPVGADADGYGPDAVNELLRGQQRAYSPSSDFLDYSIGGIQFVGLVQPGTYKEGDAFSTKAIPVKSLDTRPNDN